MAQGAPEDGAPEEVPIPRGKDPTIMNSAASIDQKAERFYNAALLLSKGQVAKFEDGSLWKANDLYAKAIELWPTLAPAYGNLALLLSPDGKVQLSGVEWGPQQLYVRAIELDGRIPVFYVNLSTLLGPEDQVAFQDGTNMDRIQLLLRAIEAPSGEHHIAVGSSFDGTHLQMAQVDPKCAMAYGNLGVLLPTGSKAKLPDGSEKTKDELLALGRSLDPQAVPEVPPA